MAEPVIQDNNAEFDLALEVLTELYDNGNEHIKELILTGLEELLQLVKDKNRESWDE